MSNCINCAGPLPANQIICQYCGAKNDTDLKGIPNYVQEANSDRICPRCTKSLVTITFELGENFFIEKCHDCLGLFFEPGELESILEGAVSRVFDINYHKIDHLNKVLRHQEYAVQYIKCPVCQKIMNRVNFGSRSGVIVDRCKDHGIWLDGGELRHLLEWVKAGGKLLQAEKDRENERLALERKRTDEMIGRMRQKSGDYNDYDQYGHTLREQDNDLFSIVKKVAIKLFS